jgi:hypothetical protein
MHGVSVRVSPPLASSSCSHLRNRNVNECRALKFNSSLEDSGSVSVGCHAHPNPIPPGTGCCRCGRRGLLSAYASLSVLLPFHPFSASAAPPRDPTVAALLFSFLIIKLNFTIDSTVTYIYVRSLLSRLRWRCYILLGRISMRSCLLKP